MTMNMPRTWFKVLIFYSRPEDGYRAFRLFMQLERRFNDEFMFENNLYPLESLQTPENAEQALYEATEADLIITAMDSSSTGNFEHWFQQIPTARCGQRRLVLNLSAEEDPNSSFRRLVARKGMDFISTTEAKDFSLTDTRDSDTTEEEVEVEHSWKDRGLTQSPYRRMGTSVLESVSRH
jgi:hypothetical protein